jgi:hypothetical protein
MKKAAWVNKKKKERIRLYFIVSNWDRKYVKMTREREKGSCSVGVASHPLVFHEFL